MTRKREEWRKVRKGHSTEVVIIDMKQKGKRLGIKNVKKSVEALS